LREHGPKKRLAVIGGGMAGHVIAHAMQDTMNVSLIDPKTYVEVPMAVPRLLVEPDALPARIPYVQFLPRVTLIQGHATLMTDWSVDVETSQGAKQTVDFDYAVIASGSRYSDPLIKAAAASETERSAELATAHELYLSARTVVIVGGGAVGVEIAGEFVESLPNAKVIIVDSGKKLLQAAPSKFGTWAERFMMEHGVEVLLNDRVTSPSVGKQPTNGVVTTASGRTIKADAVIWATGVNVATEFAARAWPDAAEPDGRLKTDRFLRLVNHPTLFVAGDATNLPERRMAIVAGLHAPVVIKNLKALAVAANPVRVALTPYKPHPPNTAKGRMMFVTLGRHGGLSSLPFGQFRAAFLARIKSEDMLVGRVRKGVGIK
jgi:NADH dehydrogenase FAD-containing subunit